MGEMMADTLRDETEIGKAAVAENIFKTSISFGRFENDLLSWERWSSFSQNKYLEEVEKCATPGSVAEKKAYFEAHYKRIAARKAELVDQEQQIGDDSWGQDSPNDGNPVINSCATKFEFDSLDLNGISDRVPPGTKSTPSINGTQTDESNQDVVGVSCQSSFGERVKGEADGLQDTAKSNKLEVTVLVEEENQLRESLFQLEELSVSGKEESQLREAQVQMEEMPILVKIENDSTGMEGQLEKVTVSVKGENDSIGMESQSEKVSVLVLEEDQLVGSQDPLLQSQKLDKRSNSQVDKAKDAKVKLQQAPQKAKSQSTLARTKKKPVTAVPKATQNSLPRASKPIPATPARPTTSTSTRKDNSPSLLRNKSPSVPSVAQSKRSTPSSLHMSLSMEPVNSDSTTTTMTRRSFIMEKMGDKEIVKRAFRTFQNNFKLPELPNDPKPSSPQQGSRKGTERVTSSSMTPRKENGGMKKQMAVANPHRAQVGGKNSVSAGPIKAAGERYKIANATPSTFGLRSDARAQKQKEFSKKSDKSTAKEVERSQRQPTPKDKKEADIKSLRQSPIKTTSLPNKNRGQATSKIQHTKENAK